MCKGWSTPALCEFSQPPIFIMTPLLPKLPERLQDDAHIDAVSAYNICLRVESSIQQAVNNNENISGNDIIYIRILGYFIHFVPMDLGLRMVVTEISSAKSDRALLNVGKMYFNHYIRACGFPNLLIQHTMRCNYQFIGRVIRMPVRGPVEYSVSLMDNPRSDVIDLSYLYYLYMVCAHLRTYVCSDLQSV